MRVLVNRLAPVGPKTGVGHYTAELLRCLHAQAGPDRIDAFPDGWLWHLRQQWSRPRADAVPPPADPTSRPRGSPWGQGLDAVRACGRRLLEWRVRPARGPAGDGPFPQADISPPPRGPPPAPTPPPPP